MAPLNRSQYLQGDFAEGPVLAGKVQGVKEGEGTKIGPDGSISVDAATAKGLVKTNNPDAFNEYTFPNEDGTSKTFLSTDGGGNVTWQLGSNSPSVHIGPSAPENALPGQLWYKSGTRQMLILENVDGGSKWTLCHQGLDVNSQNFSCVPGFEEGDGTSPQEAEDNDTGGPFTVINSFSRPGEIKYFSSVISVSGLAPYQYVPIQDLNGEANGHRFGVSNTHADENGVLNFSPRFHDSPESESSTAYTALYEVGFSGVYVSASSQILAPLVLNSAGNLSGGNSIRGLLNYQPGFASGGVPPYTYNWSWRRASSSEVIQEGGDNLQIPRGMVDDQIYVELEVIDSRQERVILSTANFPASPESIRKGQFPLTDVAFPKYSNQEAETIWKDQDMMIYSTGCAEIKIDDGSDTWGQQPRAIKNGQKLLVRWLDSDSCLGSPHGTTIQGCVESEDYIDCDYLVIDKIPSPFVFNPLKDITPGSLVVSNTITPIGYNARSFVTYSGAGLSLSELEASLDGGSTWAVIPAIGQDILPIQPGETLTVRGRVGDVSLTNYLATVNIGQDYKVQSSNFSATTSNITDFITAVPTPVTTFQGYESEPAPVTTWVAGDGSQTISCTGCLEFRVNGGAWRNSGSAAIAIATGNSIEARWALGSTCGSAPNGMEISGTLTNGSNKVTKRSMIIDRVPAAFSFKNNIAAAPSSVVSSSVVSLSGYNADCYVSLNSGSTTLAGPQISISSGTFVGIPNKGSTSLLVRPVVPGNPPRTLQIRGTTGNQTSTNYTLSLNAGSTGDSTHTTSWSVKTSDLIKTVSQPSIVSPVNGSKGINPNSISPPGVILSSNSYVSLNGAGPHASTSWEVRGGSTGGTTILARNNSDSDLTQVKIPLESLMPSSTYFARVRYHSSDGVDSEWSNWIKYETSQSFSLSWVRRFSSSVTAGGVPERLIWAGDRFLSVGYKFGWLSPKKSTFLRSLDGKSWTVYQYGGTGQDEEYFYIPKGLCYNPVDGNSYAIGTVGLVQKTTNGGVSWEPVNTSGATIVTQNGIAFGSGVFVSVGNSGTIQTSTNNCVTWNLRSSGGVTDTLRDVIYANGKFWACGGNKILSSTNGVSWTVQDVGPSPDGKPLNRIAYREGRFVIARYESNYIETSPDGQAWTRIQVPHKFEFVAAGGIWFVAGGSSSSDKFEVFSSVDNGVTWNKDYSDLSQLHAHGFAYSPELGRWAGVAHDFTAYSTI